MPTTVKKRANKLFKKATRSKRRAPVWKGPEVDGITQSMIGRYLVCKERFRVRVIEGFRPNEGFRVPLEYGNMIHLCEEYHGVGEDWQKPLRQYCADLCRQYPNEQKDVDKWYRICKIQYPIYLKYWKQHKDEKKRVPISYEQEFGVPYDLPSGRTVILRGKIDGLDTIGKGRNAYCAMKENKARGSYNELKLQQDLTFDLQTMMYFIACQIMEQRGEIELPAKLNRIRYNVIRRPLGGGAKGQIRQRKNDTLKEYYERLEEVLEEHKDEYYTRFEVHINQSDVDKFKNTFLTPCLEEICDWYYKVTNHRPKGLVTAGVQNYRLPYGTYNNVREGYGADVDEYLRTESTVGLERVLDLFPELGFNK